MSDYTVSGGTDADGEYTRISDDNGQPRYQRGSDDWYLRYIPESGEPPLVSLAKWIINQSLVADIGFVGWSRESTNPVGEYFPAPGSSGAATVADSSQVNPPAPTGLWAVLQFNSGPLAGRYIVTRENV